MDALNAEVWNLFNLLSLLSVYKCKCSKSVGHVFCHKKHKRDSLFARKDHRPWISGTLRNQNSLYKYHILRAAMQQLLIFDLVNAELLI